MNRYFYKINTVKKFDSEALKAKMYAIRLS